MGAPDIVSQAFMRQPKVFADAFNLALYNGCQVITPNSLQEVDPTLLFLGKQEQKTRASHLKLFRDVVKMCTIQKDGRATYILLGIENQNFIDVTMPMRTMIYDALSYHRQLTDLKHHYRSHGNQNKEHIIPQIPATAKFYPVITLVINFSTKPWSAPVRLHEMFTECPPELLKYIPDHQFFLLDPHTLSKRKLKRLRTDLQIICETLRLCNHRTELKNLLNKDPRFRHMDELTAKLLIQTLSLKLDPHPQNNGEINMCQAIEEMLTEERLAGEKSGFDKGEKSGFDKGALAILKKLVESNMITREQADIAHEQMTLDNQTV